MAHYSNPPAPSEVHKWSKDVGQSVEHPSRTRLVGYKPSLQAIQGKYQSHMAYSYTFLTGVEDSLSAALWNSARSNAQSDSQKRKMPAADHTQEKSYKHTTTEKWPMQIDCASTISDIEPATPYQSQKNALMQGIWQPQPLTPQYVSSGKALFLSPHSQRLQLLADRAGFDFDLRTPAKQYN